ncbi:unnamed protein product [Euphydryas editha]|uniref:Uncharacterized protein n=1 Tax=Euphydryas editha TaxID=104508 RepID=A0AAU9UWY7_EUPED|nr:unnamed protein product [Euphydryas editha]
MGGVKSRSAREGRRDGDVGGVRGTGARRRDAEGVRPRGPPHTPVPVASTGGREPAPRRTDADSSTVYAGFSYFLNARRNHRADFSISLVSDSCRARISRRKSQVESFWREKRSGR